MRRRLACVLIALAPAHVAQARTGNPAASTDGPKARASRVARKVVAFARHQIGVRYSWGGSSRRAGFDCSGLVYAAYRSVGHLIPHSTWGQMGLGVSVRWPHLRAGDLLFTDGGSHVILVASPTVGISAPGTGSRVRYVQLEQFRTQFVGARRLLR
jgi:peptidoglycan DL-endopeptidase CwlO